MLVLIAVGLALILVGGLVLLRFADRPGGTIAWLGLEVSSTGAGRPPLIAPGVVAVAIRSVRAQDGRGATSAPTRAVATPAPAAGGGGDDCIAGFLAERRETLGACVYDHVVIGTGEDRGPPVGLRLTDRGTPGGAVRLSYDPAGVELSFDFSRRGGCSRT